MEKKVCLNCKKEIKNKRPAAKKQWSTRKYCSRQCTMSSVEVRQKISKANKGKLIGDKNPFWRGGLMPIDITERKNYISDCNFKRTYKVDSKYKQQLYDEQKGQCFFFQLCKKYLPANWRKAIMDHDHKTGKIRRLLCNSCNVAMSGIDNEQWLQEALSYRKKYL